MDREELMTDRELLDLYVEDLKSLIREEGKVRPKFHKWKIFEKLGKFLIDANDKVDLVSTDRRVWIWSDPHFHHRNIIRYSDRPFRDLDHMHEELLSNHNSKVGKDDVVIWLGDVGFGPDQIINQMLSEYNGRKILVMGNHDLNRDRFKELEFDEIHVVAQAKFPEVHLCFTHYPMKNLPKPIVNVHGHEHKGGTYYTNGPQHFNACLEWHEYSPIALDLVREIAAEKAKKMINKITGE